MKYTVLKYLQDFKRFAEEGKDVRDSPDGTRA